ncbi:TraR/DksA family transcriptional regulator [Candidatus Babeliales bacterium]|nr:TraR/DksA family transcriptional regulator [Candidatus Babeliales bacterium]MBP9843751.1 TraR/DksA family transcriptional regulator [Candidatus Babeliales bacterium]
MVAKTHLDTIKQELLVRKKILEEELDRLSKEPISDNQSQDDGDQAVSSTLETLRNSIQNAEYEEYVMIESALEAIANGTYGVCQDCQQEISEKRLKYYPNAQRCLACQEAAEVTSF